MSVKARSTWVRNAATSAPTAYTLRCGAANISPSCSLSAMEKVRSARQCNAARWGRNQVVVFHHRDAEDTEKKKAIRERTETLHSLWLGGEFLAMRGKFNYCRRRGNHR